MSDAKLEILLTARDMSANTFRRFQGYVTSLTKSVFSLQGAFGALAGTTGLGLFGREVFDTGRQVARLEKAFGEITGSTEAAGREFDFLRETSDKLGQNFYELAASYKNILAASKGLALEGEQTRKIFTGIVQAGASLGLTSEQISGALNAVQQMMSKGKVQAEELRGQLGERLPGAFNLAAEAMGVSTAELNKMLDRGEVMADDLLPRLADLLQQRYPGAVDAATRASNEWAEAWTDIKNTMAQSGFLDSVSNAMQGIADTLSDPNVQQVLADFAANMGTLVENLAELAKYAGLRSILGTMGKAAELAQRGLLDWDKFVSSGFVERQRMVDAAISGPAVSPHESWRLGTVQSGAQAPAAVEKQTEEIVRTVKDIGERWLDEARALNAAVRGIELDWESALSTSNNWAADARGLNAAERQLTNDLVDTDLTSFFEDLDEAAARYKQFSDTLIDLSQHTAEAMQDAFSDFFYDAMRGELKNLEDYVDAFLAAIQRSIAQYLSQLLVQYFRGYAGGASPGGGGGAAQPATQSAAPAAYAYGTQALPQLAAPAGSAPPGARPAGPMPVTVNLVNESGNDMSAQSKAEFDGQGIVIDIVLDGINRNVGGLRDAIRGGR